MKELKLLLLEKGDSQKNLVDKVNYNFSQIISFDGGPYGKIGPEGKPGSPGSSGPKGSFGPQGSRGNRWTVSEFSPSNPRNGDYWLNPILNNQTRIYNSSTSTWDLYSVNIGGLDLFREYGPLQTPSGISSKSGYFISLPSPLANTLVLSDSLLTSGSNTANPRYSKLVISTDSSNSERRILEFSKSQYQGTSFDSLNPHFFWTQGPTSTEGNYSLSFVSPQNLGFKLGGDFSMRSLSGNILLKSGDPLTYKLNSYLTGTYNLNSSFGGMNMDLNSGMGSLLFQSKNINLPTSGTQTISTSTILDVRSSGTTGSQPTLNVISTGPTSGNIYYKMDEVYPPTRSGSTLFKATNSTTNILEISGKGDFKIDKSVYPLHPLTNPVKIVNGPFSFTLVSPSISSFPGGTGFNASRGIDYYITPSGPPITFESLLLYCTPTGEGWLDLIDIDEYMNFRVHSSESDKGFRYVGIADDSFGSTGSVIPGFGYCTSVEFTVINISKTSSGTGPTDRWFKVLYQAYGGDLNSTGPVCGELYTNGSTP
jgi:hypothetical protein